MVVNIKSAFVIGASALVGLITIAGTAYGINRHNYQVNLANAKEQIPTERTDLATLKTKIARLEPDAEGFLPASTTQATINQYKKSLNSMKDSYVDFGIAQSDLKSQLSFVRLTKASLLQEIKGIQIAFDREHSVNALFTSPAIVGDQVKAQPIKDTITQAQVTKVRQTALSGVKSSSKVAQAITNLLKDASNQVKQTDTAKSLVNALFDKGKVKSGVSLDAVNKAKSEVSKIQNASVKNPLLAQVAAAYQVADTNAKNAADAQAKKTGGQVVKNPDGTYTVSVPQTSTSASSGGSASGNTGYSGRSASSGSGSGSSGSNYQGGNGSSYSGGGSSSDSSTGSYTQKPSSPSGGQGNTAASSPSGGSGGSSSGGSSSSGKGWSTTGTQTGSGYIKDKYGDGSSGTATATWSGGTFSGAGFPQW